LSQCQQNEAWPDDGEDLFDINVFVIPETAEDRKTTTHGNKIRDGVDPQRPEHGTVEGAARSLSAAIS
jgi:hypothetical protein